MGEAVALIVLGSFIGISFADYLTRLLAFELMNYTISIRQDEQVIAERSASAEMVVVLLAEMLKNNPDIARLVDNRVEDREVGGVRKGVWPSVKTARKAGKRGPNKT